MKIQYIGKHLAQISIEGHIFNFDETKDVADGAGAEILKNRDFLDERGRNENFECGGCSAQTFETAKSTPGGAVSLRHEDGKLRCGDCYEPVAAVAVPADPAKSAEGIADITALAVRSASSAASVPDESAHEA